MLEVGISILLATQSVLILIGLKNQKRLFPQILQLNNELVHVDVRNMDLIEVPVYFPLRSTTYTWGVHVVRYPNFFLGNGSR